MGPDLVSLQWCRSYSIFFRTNLAHESITMSECKHSMEAKEFECPTMFPVTLPVLELPTVLSVNMNRPDPRSLPEEFEHTG